MNKPVNGAPAGSAYIQYDVAYSTNTVDIVMPYVSGKSQYCGFVTEELDLSKFSKAHITHYGTRGAGYFNLTTTSPDTPMTWREAGREIVEVQIFNMEQTPNKVITEVDLSQYNQVARIHIEADTPGTRPTDWHIERLWFD